jgi:hypothetical protein
MNTKRTTVSMEPAAQAWAYPLNQELVALLSQYWCDACAKPTWVVTPAEAVEIVSLSSNYFCLRSHSLFDQGKDVEVVSLNPQGLSRPAGKTGVKPTIHVVTTSTGLALVCLKSLFLCLFSVTNEVVEAAKIANTSSTSTAAVSVVVTNVVAGKSNFESITSIDRHSDLNRLIHSHR